MTIENGERAGLALKEKTIEVYWTPVIVLDATQFQALAKLTSAEIIEFLEVSRKRSKAAVNYFWDNTHFRFADAGGLKEYTFTVMHGMLSVWEVATGLSVGNYMFSDEDPQSRVAAFAKAVTEATRYGDGEFHCGCGQWFSKAEIGGRIYAGASCKTCANTPEFRREKALEGR